MLAKLHHRHNSDCLHNWFLSLFGSTDEGFSTNTSNTTMKMSEGCLKAGFIQLHLSLVIIFSLEVICKKTCNRIFFFFFKAIITLLNNVYYLMGYLNSILTGHDWFYTCISFGVYLNWQCDLFIAFSNCRTLSEKGRNKKEKKNRNYSIDETSRNRGETWRYHVRTRLVIIVRPYKGLQQL